MAHTTEGRVAKPERRWGCRRGTPYYQLISQKRLPIGRQ